MPQQTLRVLAVAGAFLSVQSSPAHAGHADAVVSYTPGSGYAVEFDTGLGYTLSEAALGEPSRFTTGQFPGPVDPFSPAYLREQLVSLGAGGSLVVQFNSPIQDNPLNPYGLDFLIFGNTGFFITNGDYSGGGITDGSMFGAAAGGTRVSVSADGNTFFTLNPALAPAVDANFPTDGSGNFGVPVNPALTLTDFNGKGLTDIRELYAGSAGGVGYDLAWAQDANGNPIGLAAISFIRVDVLGDKAEIDGFATVSAVPEPQTWALLALGAALLLRRRSVTR